MEDEKKLQTTPELVEIFTETVSDYRAGDPQKTTLKWVGLKPCEIQNKLGERNWEVSTYLIKELLKQGGYAQRSYLKSACLKNVPNRNEQFEKISSLKAHFLHEGLPVLSIDTKKKELLGNFYRKGTYYDLTHRKVNDHDFRSQADGIVIPHGIYDVGDNFGYLSLGNSKDTSAFVCDNLAYFWQNDLQWKYPNAQALLILCDGGGSNNASHYIVKQDLYWLAQKLDIDILVAHYPPYCSKWNPIEHRLFCHVHRAWEGAVFQNMELVKELAEMTTTSTGLGIKVRINDKEYQTKRQASPKFKNHIEKFVQFDEKLPKWNYWVKTRKRKVIF